jgi:hypothetical protein
MTAMSGIHKTADVRVRDAGVRNNGIAEREACAQVADDRAAFWAAAIYVSKTIKEARANEARLIAAAIRARGET